MAENVYGYILASQRGFTKKHDIKTLVYFEQFGDPTTAIQREKTMKFWKRQWKINKIEEHNPTWRDLFDEIAAG